MRGLPHLDQAVPRLELARTQQARKHRLERQPLGIQPDVLSTGGTYHRPRCNSCCEQPACRLQGDWLATVRQQACRACHPNSRQRSNRGPGKPNPLCRARLSALRLPRRLCLQPRLTGSAAERKIPAVSDRLGKILACPIKWAASRIIRMKEGGRLCLPPSTRESIELLSPRQAVC